ncbi:MAG TPA: sigma-70 family RNA polymerase sigma factor [Ktedonobacteraceae bacterium]|nr:sigma-70 family RNA polymerase sigma factor [Ktedonobacteraceae bacterium]
MVELPYGVGADDSDPDPQETLVRYNNFIVALVEQLALRSSNLARPEVLDLEIDEIAQRVRIKLWHALEDKYIEHPKAYIRTMVRNEFNDLARKRKPPLPLITDDDGELFMGDVKVAENPGMADPADEFEESESLRELMDTTASAVEKLSPRQQFAIGCALFEQVDERLQLIEAFQKRHIDIVSHVWPEDKNDKRLLKASVSPARHKLAESLSLDLDAYKKKA